MAVLFVAQIPLRYAYDGLIAVAFVLMLPAIAVLHIRQIAVRDSGAVLGMISATAAVVLGVAASVVLDLRPAALVALGMWWWTVGKMWVQTGIVPSLFGIVTATLGGLAFAGALLFVIAADALVPGQAAGQAWTIVHAVVGVWLVGLAMALLRKG